MPIRLNLFAEDQAAEELRRRDPVKRVILGGVLLVGVVVVWCCWLQFVIFWKKKELSSLQAAINTQSNQYQQVLGCDIALQETSKKLAALHEFATNRFLWGTVLNALQQTTIDDVRLTRFKGDQTYVSTEGTKQTIGDAGKVLPGRPPTATERVVLTLEAKDTGPGEGDNILRYMEALRQFPYFQEALGKTNEVKLANQSPPLDDTETGRKSVKFSLECRLSEKTR